MARKYSEPKLICIEDVCVLSQSILVRRSHEIDDKLYVFQYRNIYTLHRITPHMKHRIRFFFFCSRSDNVVFSPSSFCCLVCFALSPFTWISLCLHVAECVCVSTMYMCAVVHAYVAYELIFFFSINMLSKSTHSPSMLKFAKCTHTIFNISKPPNEIKPNPKHSFILLINKRFDKIQCTICAAVASCFFLLLQTKKTKPMHCCT